MFLMPFLLVLSLYITLQVKLIGVVAFHYSHYHHHYLRLEYAESNLPLMVILHAYICVYALYFVRKCKIIVFFLFWEKVYFSSFCI